MANSSKVIKVPRRSSKDDAWQDAKRRVFNRDKGCRFLHCLTLKEIMLFNKLADSSKNIIDPAHMFAVSKYPKFIYDVDNIVALNRYSHKHLDDCEDPITGDPITIDERDAWWLRIAGLQYKRMLIKIKKSEESIE